MAHPDVIRDTGDTLRDILRSSMDPEIIAPESIVLVTPDEFETYRQPSTPTVTIFLYRVAVNPQMRNGPRRTLEDGTTRALLPVDLSFMITPWAAETRDEYRIIGRILQALYDNAELGPAQLQGDSWDPGDSVQIILESLPLDDHYRIWDSTGLPYRLSLTYLIRVIGIEPTEIDRTVPVLEAEYRRLRSE